MCASSIKEACLSENRDRLETVRLKNKKKKTINVLRRVHIKPLQLISSLSAVPLLQFPGQ